MDFSFSRKLFQGKITPGISKVIRWEVISIVKRRPWHPFGNSGIQVG